MFIDTHAHLDFEKFDSDREEVIQRAFSSGVEKIINIGCNLESSQASVELAKKYENVWAAVGVHPDEAGKEQIPISKFQIPNKFQISKFKIQKNNNKDRDKDYIVVKLRELIKKFKKVVAVGEVGLDYYWMNCAKELQVKALKEQLKLAKEFELPVILHCRNAKDGKMNAYSDCLEILIAEKREKAVFHCFSGTLEFAKKVWDKGFLTSFTGIVTYPNAKEVQEVVRNCPNELFMIETDCPFLAPVFVPQGGTTPGKPQKYRGQRNEPSFVIEVAKKIAEIKGVEIGEIEKSSTDNAEKFFTI